MRKRLALQRDQIRGRHLTAILPTPAIGGVGLIDDWEKAATLAFKAEGEDIYIVGDTAGRLGQSLWLREVAGREDGPPPRVTLDYEKKAGEFIRWLIEKEKVTAVHDCSDGGLLVAVAEMALASGIGARLHSHPGPIQAWAFGEDQGRYIVTVPAGSFRGIGIAPVRLYQIGQTGGDRISAPFMADVALADLRAAHEGFFPKLMGDSLSPS